MININYQNKNILNLNKLTVVILTYNRHESLIRTLEYWSNTNVNLLIIDGSKFKLEHKSINSKNINYIHEPKSFYERFLLCINFVQTEYVIMSSDDEFYLQSALSACIDVLEKDKSYSSCGGCAIGFFKQKGKFLAKKVYLKLFSFSLSQLSSIDRLQIHFSNYVMAHYWSVMRTNNWKIICKNVFEKEYGFYAAHELQVEFLSVISGKSTIIPELMWMRNYDNSQIQGTNPACEPNYTINDWWIDHAKSNEKNDFIERMKKASEILSNDKNLEISKDIIVKTFENLINWEKSRKSFKDKIVKYIPRKFKDKIKLVLFKFGLKKNLVHRDIISEAKLLEKKGIFVNYNELDYIISNYLKND